jgi:predicted signal transduction protein with EAL and GGDEF domain
MCQNTPGHAAERSRPISRMPIRRPASLAGVEQVALRIERSFDEPVAAAEYLLHASASVGVAVFPMDALTKDGLLNAADSAMYQTKNAKKQIAQMLAGHRGSDSDFNGNARPATAE